MTPPVDPNQVLMTGENSFIRLSPDGGKTITDRLSHWRVLWCPAGDQSTRQWLTRSTIVLPLSFDRRMNEFSPVIRTSCGSAMRGSLMPAVREAACSRDRYAPRGGRWPSRCSR